MAVTFPAPSDSGTWDAEEDYTDAFAADTTNLTAATNWELVQGSAGTWTYLASSDGWRNANTVASYYVYDDGASDFTDVEVLFLVNQTDWTATARSLILGARNSKASGTGYGMRHYSTDDWDIFDFASVVEVGSGSATPDPADNDDVWVRFQASGSDLKASAWLDGDSDPGWLIETTDTSSTAGFPLLFGLLSASAVSQVTVKAFAYQLNPGAGGAGVTVSPGSVSVSASVGQPSVSVSALVSAVASVSALSGESPNVGAGPDAVSVLAQVPDPSVATGAVAEPQAAAVSVAFPPLVSVGEPSLVSAFLDLTVVESLVSVELRERKHLSYREAQHYVRGLER